MIDLTRLLSLSVLWSRSGKHSPSSPISPPLYSHLVLHIPASFSTTPRASPKASASASTPTPTPQPPPSATSRASRSADAASASTSQTRLTHRRPSAEASAGAAGLAEEGGEGSRAGEAGEEEGLGEGRRRAEEGQAMARQEGDSEPRMEDTLLSPLLLRRRVLGTVGRPGSDLGRATRECLSRSSFRPEWRSSLASARPTPSPRRWARCLRASCSTS